MRSVRLLSVAAVLVAGLVHADEPPDDLCGNGLKAGDSCRTDDGRAGTCVQKTFEFDIGDWHRVQTWLLCVAPAAAAERSMLPWFGAAMAFLALVVGLRLRPPSAPSSNVTA